jgi:hypothetical protein
MSPGTTKFDPRGLVRAHYRTYVDATTGDWSPQDHIWSEGLPALTVIGCLVGNVRLPTGASVGLLTVTGLLSAFLFGVMLQVSERAMDWADSSPDPSPETSQHARYLSELAANSGYASLVCVCAAGVFIAASVSLGWPLRISSAVGLGLTVHMALVLFMVMKRVFALTQERLNRARTGADRRDAPRRHAS